MAGAKCNATDIFMICWHVLWVVLLMANHGRMVPWLYSTRLFIFSQALYWRLYRYSSSSSPWCFINHYCYLISYYTTKIIKKLTFRTFDLYLRTLSAVVSRKLPYAWRSWCPGPNSWLVDLPCRYEQILWFTSETVWLSVIHWCLHPVDLMVLLTW